ncbi:MAG: hypothetical protein ACRDSJ_25675 [Rubrobacteraceae bacterium]
MGMYDEIRREYPLPQTGYRVLPEHTFQTKDLECLLDKYTITASGLLILHREVWEPVPEEERPYYGSPEWEKPLGKWIGSMRSVPVGDEEIPHHGDIFFYDSFTMKGESGHRIWLEYRTRFTEGSLARIKVEDVHDLPPTKTVELGDSEFQAQESGLGFDIIRLGDEAEVEPES